MGEERRALLHKQIYQAPDDGRGIVDPYIGSLAKKERDIRSAPMQSCQLVDDTAQQHCLAFAWITSNPEDTITLVVLPLFEHLVV
jgi:hypothetical protein